jgi:hypothetical protein
MGFDQEDYECSCELEVGETRLIMAQDDDIRIIRLA